MTPVWLRRRILEMTERKAKINPIQLALDSKEIREQLAFAQQSLVKPGGAVVRQAVDVLETALEFAKKCERS